MKRNRMPSWMGLMMRFSSNFSIPTMRICRRSSTRLSLSKIRSKRWRRMARGKHHSRDSLQEATLDLACLSQGLSSETSLVHPSMHGQHSPFHMQRPNIQAQHPNFQMHKPQPQAHRPSVQQPSRQNIQQDPRPTAPTSQNAPAQGSHHGRAYFKCGLTGHFAW
jgi:hypothetical protein